MSSNPNLSASIRGSASAQRSRYSTALSTPNNKDSTTTIHPQLISRKGLPWIGRPSTGDNGRSVAGSTRGVSVVSAVPSAQPSFASTAYQATGHGRAYTTSADYSPGMIILTYHTSPNMDPNARTNDSSIGFVSETGYVSGKRRPFIVLSITETHMKCIPMFTSGGRGFHNKPADEQRECIYLRDWKDNGNEWDGAQPTDYLMLDQWSSGKPGAYINWNRTYDVLYQWPIVIMGAITTVSFERLKTMHIIGYRMAFRKVVDQVGWANSQLSGIEIIEEYKLKTGSELETNKTHIPGLAANNKLTTSKPSVERGPNKSGERPDTFKDTKPGVGKVEAVASASGGNSWSVVAASAVQLATKSAAKPTKQDKKDISDTMTSTQDSNSWKVVTKAKR